MLSTVSAVKVPTEVIALCADPVTVAAEPLTLPVRSPTKLVAVKAPLEELKVKFDPVFGLTFPVAAVANNGKQEVSLLSSAAVTLDALLPTVDENERLPEPSETNASPLDDASPVGNTHI